MDLNANTEHLESSLDRPNSDLYGTTRHHVSFILVQENILAQSNWVQFRVHFGTQFHPVRLQSQETMQIQHSSLPLST